MIMHSPTIDANMPPLTIGDVPGYTNHNHVCTPSPPRGMRVGSFECRQIGQKLGDEQRESKRKIRMRKLHKISVAILILLGLFSLSACSQAPGVSLPEIPTYEIVILLSCIVLMFFWICHIYMIDKKLKELDRSKRPKIAIYSSQMPGWFSPHRWAFFLVVIFLPVGLSIISRILPMEKPVFLPELAYHFAVSVFIIMITLEIAAIYNLPDNKSNNVWRPMLTAALTIDLLAFIGFSLTNEPPENEITLGPFMITFYVASGIISIVSTFLTLYVARTYELFLRDEIPENFLHPIDE